MTRRVAPKPLLDGSVGARMSYRDEGDAARERRDALRRELAAVDGTIAAAERAEAHRQALRAALREAEREIDRARARVALPLLSNVRVASPCSARWEDMRGDDRARHCASCDKTVFDLSAMRAEDAEALLRANGAGACVRFYRRADGTVMTSDCAIGVGRARRRGWALAAGLTALAGAGVLGAGATLAGMFWAADELAPEEPELVMGEMMVEPEPLQGGVSFDPPHVAPPEPEVTSTTNAGTEDER